MDAREALLWKAQKKNYKLLFVYPIPIYIHQEGGRGGGVDGN